MANSNYTKKPIGIFISRGCGEIALQGEVLIRERAINGRRFFTYPVKPAELFGVSVKNVNKNTVFNSAFDYKGSKRKIY